MAQWWMNLKAPALTLFFCTMAHYQVEKLLYHTTVYPETIFNSNFSFFYTLIARCLLSTQQPLQRAQQEHKLPIHMQVMKCALEVQLKTGREVTPTEVMES